MSRVWPVNTLFHTWDRCLFILVDSQLKISFEKKSRQIQAESSDFILNPESFKFSKKYSLMEGNFLSAFHVIHFLLITTD